MKQMLLFALALTQIACSFQNETSQKANEQKRLISDLNMSIDSFRQIEVKLKNEKDSLDALYQKKQETYDSLKSYHEDLVYGYWERSPLYISQKKQEHFYHVRVSVLNDTIRYYFLGIDFPTESKFVFANIYELSNSEIHIIDSIKFNVSKSTATTSGHYHEETFMLRQIDNLTIEGNKIYFYKEIEYPKSSHTYAQNVSKRQYYTYDIGSKKKPQPTDDILLSDAMTFGGPQRIVINSNKTILATSNNHIIEFYHIYDWDATFNFLYTEEVSIYNFRSSLQLDFDFEKKFELAITDNQHDVPFNSYNENEVFFGGMCWHSEKDILYFDNSGYDNRCIWKVDINEDKIQKIVPEHTAIHPFFYKIAKNEYIAYVDENKIMISASPDNLLN